ncbi:hypothetical protein [Streptomyces candidus]|uniref:Uncharacterized protein n=1 Tax=Streptomyces candidus TaxID=67283 RepID=A0A7X0HJ40_9ACTN|nr:hypothetical protein [Streptomyces candidus]MBB6438470.1 hypothetical protein [Streptomyces candidus]GHH45769.1 hypothetical protein GCM10018773_35850 [Streptomyces candidus]
MQKNRARPAKIDQAFRDADGQAVQIDGRAVHLAFAIAIPWTVAGLALRFTSAVDRPEQGVCLELSSGDLLVNRRHTPDVCLWAGTTPSTVDLDILRNPTAPCTLRVWNCWRGTRGERRMWTGNAGLLVDLNPGASYRFSCSDGTGPAAFTDLVFTLKVQPKHTDPWREAAAPPAFEQGPHATHPVSANT